MPLAARALPRDARYVHRRLDWLQVKAMHMRPLRVYRPHPLAHAAADEVDVYARGAPEYRVSASYTQATLNAATRKDGAELDAAPMHQGAHSTRRCTRVRLRQQQMTFALRKLGARHAASHSSLHYMDQFAPQLASSAPLAFLCA
jgi:hypothetical protein